MDKAQLRAELKAKLMDMTPDEVESRSRDVCRHLASSEAFEKARVVMLYLAMPREVDLQSAILACWQHSKTAAVPKVAWEEKLMIPVEIKSLDASGLIEPSGLRNPVGGQPVLMEDIDLVVAPGLAFDIQGRRLGRGGGYYDRFLSMEQIDAEVMGVCFDCQVVDDVPVDRHDIPMQYLVTEKGIIDCGMKTRR